VVGEVDRQALGHLRDPGVARRAPEFCLQRALGDFPGERVFAAARSEEEDSHAGLSAGSARLLSSAARRCCKKPVERLDVSHC